MANKPIQADLHANLPVDWIDQQRITSNGVLYLDEKYGYNYLNGQVNAAQEAINTINNAFSDLANRDELVKVSSFTNYPSYTNSSSVTYNISPTAIATYSGNSWRVLPNAAITLPNPWGNSNRDIRVIASVSFQANSGGLTLCISDSLNGVSANGKNFFVGYTTRYNNADFCNVAGNFLSNTDETLSLSAAIRASNTFYIYGWSMTVVQTKI